MKMKKKMVRFAIIKFNPFSLTQSPASFQYYSTLLTRSDTRRSIHVGNRTYNNGDAVEKHLLNDVLDTVLPWLEEAMNHYKVSRRGEG